MNRTPTTLKTWQLVAAMILGSTLFAMAEPVLEYIFLGHTRNNDTITQGVVPIVERIDYDAYAMTLLGGDMVYYSSRADETLDYLDDLFSISDSNTLFATGGHDLQRPNVLTQFTGRPLFFTTKTNGVTFCVLNTQHDEGLISGSQLSFLQDTVAHATNSTHLVIMHHKVLWLVDNPDLEHHLPEVGFTTRGITNANWYADVQPMLDNLQSQGTQVLCISGERTNYNIEHTLPSGVRLMATGMRYNVSDTINNVIMLIHDLGQETLDANFVNVLDLPLKPNEDVVINEVHWNPSVEQGGADQEFIELINHGDEDVDISGMYFKSGLYYTIPTNTIMAPGEIILLAREPANYAHLPVRVFDWGSFDLQRNAPLNLRDPVSNKIVDFTWWLREPGWPDGSWGEGYTLMLRHPSMDNGPSPAWRRSPEMGGTPGLPNFPPIMLNHSVLMPETEELVLNIDGLVTGEVIQLEASASLMSNDWHAVGGAIMATNQTVVLDGIMPSASNRFFRARVTP